MYAMAAMGRVENSKLSNSAKIEEKLLKKHKGRWKRHKKKTSVCLELVLSGAKGLRKV